MRLAFHSVFALLCVFALSFASAQQAHAQEIFRCVLSDGAAVLTMAPTASGCERAAAWDDDPARVDVLPPPGASRETVSVALTRTSAPRAALRPDAYAREIREQSVRWGVPEHLVRAVIHAESTFNPRAVSPKGAIGLMQLMPATARRFGVREAFDPGQNIAGGVQYLAWLLRRFKGDWRLAIAGYNAGEGAVERHRGVPPFRETREYLAKVWRLSQSYSGQTGI